MRPPGIIFLPKCIRGQSLKVQNPLPDLASFLRRCASGIKAAVSEGEDGRTERALCRSVGRGATLTNYAPRGDGGGGSGDALAARQTDGQTEGRRDWQLANIQPDAMRSTGAVALGNMG